MNTLSPQYYIGITFHEKQKLKFEKVSSVSILKILQEFETIKTTWVDNLTGRFLKDSPNTLCTPIANICNFSIKLTSSPNKCKVAKIKSLYKKGLKTDPKNFRPISLLPLISKIIEQIIHDQTMNFLSDNNVYTNINQVLENFTQQTLVCHTSMTNYKRF